MSTLSTPDGTEQHPDALDRAYRRLRKAVGQLPLGLAVILADLLRDLEFARHAPQTAAGLYGPDTQGARDFVAAACRGAVDNYTEALLRVVRLTADEPDDGEPRDSARVGASYRRLKASADEPDVDTAASDGIGFRVLADVLTRAGDDWCWQAAALPAVQILDSTAGRVGVELAYGGRVELARSPGGRWHVDGRRP